MSPRRFRPPRRRSGPRRRTTASAETQDSLARVLTEGAPPRQFTLPHTISVKQLAESLRLNPVEIIKNLIKNGIMANINQVLDYETAATVAGEMGFQAEEEAHDSGEVTRAAGERAKTRRLREDEGGQLRPRPPIVTIMGHVDHGKTSLLDAIRETNVTAGEAGGITQHIGAYQAEVNGQRITFLDTPGHEAFTAMRARGAQATDIAVLVIAADEGVMPQTQEAIDHARAAEVPIVVAINKIDRPEINVERVKQQLTEHGLLIEEWGGDVVCVPMSARTKEGIPDLLENLLLVAEIQELKANPQRRAAGVVVEAELDNTRGPMATILVQTGTLRVGDIVVAGLHSGRVRAMFNEHGRHMRRAGPSTPVAVLGLSSVPQAGDTIVAVPDERTARTLIAQRQREHQETDLSPARAVSLDDLFGRIQAGQVKELNLILKTDVQGSIQPIRSSLEKLGLETVKVRVLHAATGNITESDVMLALASKAIIIGFNSQPEPGARRLAEAGGIDLRYYDVIYHLVEDVQKALTGLLEPVYRDATDGHAEVRQVFRLGRREVIAGSYIRDGKAIRGALVHVLRQGRAIADSRISGLRHFKDDVQELTAGYECGIRLETFDAFEVGDVVQIYHTERAPAGR